MTYEPITDLDESALDVDLSSVREVRDAWRRERSVLDPTQLEELNRRIARLWSVETGMIEGLYSFDRGITVTLVERGFEAELLPRSTGAYGPERVAAMLRDQRDAYDAVVDVVARKAPLTQAFVRELHARITQNQPTAQVLVAGSGQLEDRPLLRGAWKDTPNNPTRDDGSVHEYAPVYETPGEVQRLIDWHRAHVDTGVPAVVEAAWLHHRFAQVHPFQDGNGRVARALASLVLLGDDLLPLIVDTADKPAYIDALEAADAGDLGAFVRYLVARQATDLAAAVELIRDIATPEQLAEAAVARLADRQAARSPGVNRAREVARDLETRLDARLAEFHGSISQLAQTNIDVDLRFSLSRSSLEDSVRQEADAAAAARGAEPNWTEFAAQQTSFLATSSRRRAELSFGLYADTTPYDGRVVVFALWRDWEIGPTGRRRPVASGVDEFTFSGADLPETVATQFAPWLDACLKRWTVRWSEAL